MPTQNKLQMHNSHKIKNNIKEALSQFVFVLKNIIPRTKTELYLFLGLCIFYYSYSAYLVQNTVIHLRHGNIRGVDYYFSFDTPAVITFGQNGAVNHPLFSQFLKPIVFLGNILENEFSYKHRIFLFVLVSTIVISLSVVYIYRYIREVVELKGYPLFLFTLFFAFFWTNLVLCFSPESFPISACFLSFVIFCYTYFMKKKIPVSIVTNFLFVFQLGGITITNAIKGIIPIFFTEKKFKFFLFKSLVIGIAFSAMWLFWIKPSFTEMDTTIKTFSNIKDALPLWQKYLVFFGVPVLAPAIFWDEKGYAININFEQYYNYNVFTYLFVASIVVLIVSSVIKNYKNKAVQMLVLLILVDVGIHLICEFGIDELFLYSGHWAYTFPLFFAWLYKSLSPKYAKYMIIFVSVLFIFTFINNMFQLHNFIDLALENFPDSKRSQVYITPP